MPTHRTILCAIACCGLLRVAVSATVEETPWHEPGGVVDAAYLKDGKLRYIAEGREIVGKNKTYFNNRPLYCEWPHDRRSAGR